MSNSKKTQNLAKEVSLLKEFIHHNPDLEQLESKVSQFNVFQALGITNQEIRHSNFLAWLLDPSETHNLGDYFLKLFLKHLTYIDESKCDGLTVFDIDAADLDDTEINREWQNIDILIVNERLSLVCAIENKIDSKEHSNQLTKYYDLVVRNYKDFGHQLFVYLTIAGEETEKNPEYISYSHAQISENIEKLLANRTSQLNEDVVLFIQHYQTLLNDYIMEESELKDLCNKIYKSHKSALELIFKYKPDAYSDLLEVTLEYLKNKKGVITDHSNKSYIRFWLEDLDHFPKVGRKWSQSNTLCLFEIRTSRKNLDIYLIIGPGDSAIRDKIYQFAYKSKKTNKLFNATGKTQYKQFTSIYSSPLIHIDKEKLLELDKTDMAIEIAKALDKKFESDLPNLVDALKDLDLSTTKALF